jgi:hypothetical protein
LTVAGSVRGKLRELSSLHTDVEEPTLRALRKTLDQEQERPGPLGLVGPRLHVGINVDLVDVGYGHQIARLFLFG